MDKYFARTTSKKTSDELEEHKRPRLEFKLEELPNDPGLRQPIISYELHYQDSIRRYYLQNGPCQPHLLNFPQTLMGQKSRRFSKEWYSEYKGWLEYSQHKDAGFCLYCYIFPQAGCDQTFVSRGFRYSKDKMILEKHVGKHNSAHNASKKMCANLMNQQQSISTIFARRDETQVIEYRTRLCASIDCTRFLLSQGLSFRGHDASRESANRGNFLALLEFLASHNDDVKTVVLENAPSNCQLTSPKIQKEIVSAIASEATHIIVTDIGEECFAILVDESRDISTKEQMAVVLRYIDMKGFIIERLLGIVHVLDTAALSLNVAIDNLFMKYGLNFSKLRGQGYDGASNMKGEFNGLKTLIMKENSSAYYIHCFAHPLQLTLVAVAEGHSEVAGMFSYINMVLNIIGGSSKRRDNIRALEVDRVAHELECGELETGRGLNQPLEIKRAGETRWSSHYSAVLNFIRMFSSIVDVLEIISDDGHDGNQRGTASNLIKSISTFEFVFLLHLMKIILAKTHELSHALQRKDQDIINAMNFVKLSKQLLFNLRSVELEWKSFLTEVVSFCGKQMIDVPNMDSKFVQPGRSRRKARDITNQHHFRVELFNTVIDWVLNELNDRFNEVNTELLICVSCLDPSDHFASFNKQKLIRLAELYPYDFSPLDLQLLEGQLDMYILDMRSTRAFSHLKGISALVQKMVETKKHDNFQFVYRLLKLACLLPVATATVERMFSAMKIIKSRLRNKMGDEWMNDCLIAYIEKDIVETITNETIIERFQNMCTRKVVC